LIATDNTEDAMNQHEMFNEYNAKYSLPANAVIHEFFYQLGCIGFIKFMDLYKFSSSGFKQYQQKMDDADTRLEGCAKSV
jgi:hypothetical protein